MRIALVAILLLLASCSRPRENEPCQQNERACGQEHLGLECQNDRFVAFCSGCDRDEDRNEDDRVVNVCIADSPELCQDGPSLPQCDDERDGL